MLATFSFESDLMIVALFLIKTLNNFKALAVESEIKCTAVFMKDRDAKFFTSDGFQRLRLLICQHNFLSISFSFICHSLLYTILKFLPCVFLL
jgi:hypothetical protein